MSKEHDGVDWEKEIDRQGLSGSLRKANDTMAIFAKLLGNYKSYLIKNGFTEDEAFVLVRDYADDFLSKLVK